MVRQALVPELGKFGIQTEGNSGDSLGADRSPQ